MISKIPHTHPKSHTQIMIAKKISIFKCYFINIILACLEILHVKIICKSTFRKK
ncbi:hypothetical protein RhiirA5_171756 [Rhizophagus irregularis]|uniref:Uncharacterized protein n=1 Tax=Rhizophagus irregularis TaxID=588596 RepID=A0A2N0NKA1_9GLOM|nr:hypothetical protein RhiirA5_171756 [Rhizophagus irregularis]GET63194.1 hypothetical protein RIR_e12166_A0A2N0NKA1_9GLOM [Rhizophagus irregularis DAOM 181602=DAOM 197198]